MSKKLFLNPAQVKILAANCNTMTWIASRGNGKTAAEAAYSLDRMQKMRRSNGFFLGKTFTQMLTKTLSEVITSWERFGFKEGQHFVFGKINKKWDLPYFRPLKPKYYIHSKYGSGIFLLAQDRPAAANGLSLDWGVIDEARFLNKQKVDEILLILRGNNDKFGHMPEHLSTFFISDMPRSADGFWLLDFEKQMNPEAIQTIFELQIEIERLKQTITTSKNPNRLKVEIRTLEIMLHKLQKSSTFYLESNPLNNIAALGIEPLKAAKRTLSAFEWRHGVLNKRPNQAETSFYAEFKRAKHVRPANNYDRVDHVIELSSIHDLQRDCSWDADLVASKSIDIACDYNAKINNVVVGQAVGDEYRVLNHLYVKSPNRIKALVQKFCDYYKQHPTKIVNYYYDHTAIGTDASRTESFADEWMRELRANGWAVVAHYVGAATKYQTRFNAINNALAEVNTKTPKFRFNEDNCYKLISVMEFAEIAEGKDFEKDKSSERSKLIAPEDATHCTEAFDCLAMAKLSTQTNDSVIMLNKTA